MSPSSHFQDLQKYLSKALYVALLGDQQASGIEPPHVELTSQIATQALKEILNEIAALYEKDSETGGPLSPMNQLANSKYKAGGPNMPTLWLREISNPTPPLTPEEKLINDFAHEYDCQPAIFKSFLAHLRELESKSKGPECSWSEDLSRYNPHA